MEFVNQVQIKMCEYLLESYTELETTCYEKHDYPM